MGKINKKNNVGFIIVAKNEALKIGECLDSVSWSDEVIVMNNDSTDGTALIARKKGARVYDLPGDNFSERKNIAFRKSKSRYIFFLDADERVTEELKNEILTITKKGFVGAFAVPRRNIILGHEMKYGGWWPDYVVRLFERNSFKDFKGLLHEQPQYEGELKYLKNGLIHLKHDNFEEMLEKTNKWSEIEARLMLEAKHPPMNIPRFITAVIREGYLRFIKEKAYKDGTPGIIYALYQVVSRFISYAKLWEMQNVKKIK